MPPMTFAASLRSERIRIGYTQAQCAELLEVSKRSIEEWEAGKLPLAITAEGGLARLKKKRTPRPTR